MPYCSVCGAEIQDYSKYCPKCGSPVGSSCQPRNQPYPAEYDSGSVGWAILGFLIPLVGLILFLMWYHDRPKSAKMAGIGALANVIITFVGTIMYVAIIMAFASTQQIAMLL